MATELPRKEAEGRKDHSHDQGRTRKGDGQGKENKQKRKCIPARLLRDLCGRDILSVRVVHGLLEVAARVTHPLGANFGLFKVEGVPLLAEAGVAEVRQAVVGQVVAVGF